MRQPWRRPPPPTPTPRLRLRGSVAGLAPRTAIPPPPPTSAPPRRYPWRTIAAVASAGILGVWLFRPTRPPAYWMNANRARLRRLEAIEDQYVQADLDDRSRLRDADRAALRGSLEPPNHRALAPGPSSTEGDAVDAWSTDPEGSEDDVDVDRW